MKINCIAFIITNSRYDIFFTYCSYFTSVNMGGIYTGPANYFSTEVLSFLKINFPLPQWF